MSFFGDLFKNDPIQTTSTSSLPDWVTSAGKDLWGQASTAADKPFTAFGSNPYGGMSADSRSAISGIRDNVNYMTSGAGNDFFTKMMGKGPQSVSTERTVDENGKLGAISDYINPYVSGALQPALAKIQEASDAARKRIGAGATSARAFGDARHGITESNLNADTSQAMGDTASQFMKSVFDTAMGQRAQDLNRFGQTDATNASLEQQDFANKMTTFNNQNDILTSNLGKLLQGGQYEDTRNTQAGAFDFQEFLREQGFDQSQLGWLGSLLSGLPMDRTQTQTQSGGVGPGYGMVGGVLGGLASNV